MKCIKSIFILLFLSSSINADGFYFNNYNNHGVVGLINTPTARFYKESIHGITAYYGTPDQKIILSSNPYDWLEASFFYSNNKRQRYCSIIEDPVCKQDHKDKGFNFKLKLKDEGIMPAIAIGINDMAGTGYYSSEYIVSSYGKDNFDFHFGLAWGALNSSENIKNPLTYVNDSFKSRGTYSGQGGQFSPSSYFSGNTASYFYGISYVLNKNLVFKFEKDTTKTDYKIKYDKPKNNFSFGLDYLINRNFVIGLSYERGSTATIKFIYKNDPSTSYPKYDYKRPNNTSEDESSYSKLVKNLETNGIGVNKILEKGNVIGLDLTQFTHSNLQLVEEIIFQSSKDAGLNKDIKKNLKVVNLNAVSEYDKNFEETSKVVYQRGEDFKKFNTSTGITFRPFLASREEFFKGAMLLENNSEYIFKQDLLFNLNLKYSIADNFDDLRYPPVSTFPAQVRSDIKQYLKNMDNGILIGRAQLDFYHTLSSNNHLMFSGGILEDMFSGYGFEYLYHKPSTNYSFGFEVFNVKKRDYDWGFGHLDYSNITAHININYRNYGLIPFDMKITFGEYLAGDYGSTIEFSRTYQNGVKFGIFASKTNVTSEEFGEGSFDKGIFFNIPIYNNLINYTWRPLTKDPGAKLIRKNSLHDLLVKFQPIN